MSAAEDLATRAAAELRSLQGRDRERLVLLLMCLGSVEDGDGRPYYSGGRARLAAAIGIKYQNPEGIAAAMRNLHKCGAVTTVRVGSRWRRYLHVPTATAPSGHADGQ